MCCVVLSKALNPKNLYGGRREGGPPIIPGLASLACRMPACLCVFALRGWGGFIF